MVGHAEQCVDKYLELTGLKLGQLREVTTPCMDDHQLAPEDTLTEGALTKDAAKIVLKCLWLARITRCDLLWTVNHLAREVSKWSVACDKRLFRLVCYIHSSKNFSLYSFVGDEAKDIRLALYCDASFAGGLKDSKSTSGIYLCLVGPNTFCPITWICKKQGAISHSSAEAEIISMDAGLRRLEGIPRLVMGSGHRHLPPIPRRSVSRDARKGREGHLVTEPVPY